MRTIKEILRLSHQVGLSNRQIGGSCGLSHVAVGQYLERAEEAGLSWPVAEALDEDELHALLFDAASSVSPRCSSLPDMAYLHEQLKREGVTLQLLWEENRAAHPDGYGYTQFCAYYARWNKTLPVSLRQIYKAGEKTLVDWAGPTIPWINVAETRTEQAYLFVAVLGASNYTYVEAFPNQQLFCWIEAHIHAFEFFGGVTQVIVPDNARTGVSAACYYEPQIHPTYQEMAAYYGAAVIPARPYSPRDKAKVENAVQCGERRILAVLRNQTFFGVGEINAAIRPLLTELNARPFQKMPGSRRELFEQLDSPVLQPLPAGPYEMAEWRKGKADVGYHVQVDWHHYSVPHALALHEIEVRLAARTVELFHKGRRVAIHARSYERGGYTTDPAHRPKAHQKHLEWTPQSLIDRANTIGPYTAQVVTTILETKPHPEQGYRACLGIMRLTKDYGQERIEAACHRAIALDSCSYKSLSSILKTKMDQQPLPDKEGTASSCALTHSNVRGAAYYESKAS